MRTDKQPSSNPIFTKLGIIAIGILLLNIISAKIHYKLDLTEDKRYTLTTPTKTLLKNLKDEVTIKVYLEGTFQASFQKLRESTKELLKACNDISNNKVKFSFENPLEGKTTDEREKIITALRAKGIYPINLQVQQDDNEGLKEKIIFPWALVKYADREVAVNLLENHMGMNAIEILNYSESMLEYKIVSAINKTQNPDQTQIGYIVGNGELFGNKSIDALYTLGKNYKLDTLDLNLNIEIPTVYKAIVIANPLVPFTQKEQFKLDQYVMNGGRILWLMGGTNISLDTLAHSPNYTVVPLDLGIDEMLFKYGVRVNKDLIQDIQCNVIPITDNSSANGEPQMKMLNWVYFPILTPTAKHPIVNNMAPLSSTFVSSIDTIGNGINTKTVLLASSQYSRAIPAPATVSLNELKYAPKQELFNKKYLPIGVLIQGSFQSVFANRIDPAFAKLYQDSLHKQVKESIVNNKMIVVSNGELISNEFSEKNGPSEMGYYKFTKDRYANKTFLLNAMEYLTDESGLLQARNKDVKLRLLDIKKVKKYKLQYQLLNIVLPIILLLIFASGYLFFRKKKYETPKTKTA